MRAFAPDVVNHSFPGYHWIYWLGPALGALLAATFYYILEALGWETANPGQDYDDIEAQALVNSKETLPSRSSGNVQGQATMTTQV